MQTNIQKLLKGRLIQESRKSAKFKTNMSYDKYSSRRTKTPNLGKSQIIGTNRYLPVGISKSLLPQTKLEDSSDLYIVITQHLDVWRLQCPIIII